VENIPKKLEQNRPMKHRFYFSALATNWAPSLLPWASIFYEAKCFKARKKLGPNVHRSCADFGFSRMLHFWVIFQQFSTLTLK